MKSTLLDEIRAISTAGGTRHKIEQILGQLDADDAEALIIALHDSEITPSQITKALAHRDIKVGNAAVRNWREANK